jgi:tetratricopeptide (TPR) repeat protein
MSMSEYPQSQIEVFTNVSAGGSIKIGSININQQSPPKYVPTYVKSKLKSSNFVGRDDVLTKLDTSIEDKSVMAVVGMAGVGKTELALQYADRYRKKYAGGCYLFKMLGLNLAKVLADYTTIDLKLHIPPQITDLNLADVLAEDTTIELNLEAPEITEKRKIARGKIAQWCWREWERNLPTESKVLVVLDHVDEKDQIRDMLPSSSRFRLLVTTRTHTLIDATAEERLDVLTDVAALKLLKQLVGKDRVGKELRAAESLCGDMLGYLPLGIELTGRYLQEDDEVTIADLIGKLSVLQEALDGEDDRAEPPSDMTAERGVKSALELSWQRLGTESRTVAKLMGLCGPKAIPWELVTRMAGAAELKAAGEEKTDSAREVRKQLAEKNRIKGAKKITIKKVRLQLKNWHLMKWDKDSNTATLHALIRSFFHEKAQTAANLTQIFVNTMLERAHQTSQDSNLERVAGMRDIVPHIEEVALHYTHHLSDEDLVWLFIGVARFYDRQGLYIAGSPWYNLCLKRAEQRLGANSLHTATSLNNLAVSYISIGNYAAAEPLYIRALQIKEQQLEATRSDTATSLNHQTRLDRSSGNYPAALPLYQRALQIREQQLEATHSDTATSLNHLAGLYESIGKYAAAEPLYVRALQIREQQLGANHPDTATSLNDLAGLYESIDRSEEALALYARAVEICEQALGLEHPSTVKIRGNYEICLRSQTDDR